MLWIPFAAMAVTGLLLWGGLTWRLTAANQALALQLEAERQRNFGDMAWHVEQIQALLAKGRAAGGTRQNMRYMGDVYHHALSAAANFGALPLPPGVQASAGKFLQQTGDFARTLLRNEAAGREMDPQGERELARLRKDAGALSAQFNAIAESYRKGNFRWTPTQPTGLAALVTMPGRKPSTGSQAPASLVPGGWEQVGASMEKMPVLLYDGPFSDKAAQRAPAMTGPPVTQEEALRRLPTYMPNAAGYTLVGSADAGGTLPAWSFRLAPAGAPPGTNDYTAVAEVTKNGGYLLQMLNGRAVGRPTIDLTRAKGIAQAYLAAAGFPNMVPTYGQTDGGTSTIAFAAQENGVILYPDQAKVKVALDTGEVIGADARQYLMSHHPRSFRAPRVDAEQARDALNPDLQVQRVQLALIPGPSETGEVLTYEFLTRLDEDTFLVYVNAETGVEEIILQLIEVDGGTLVL